MKDNLTIMPVGSDKMRGELEAMRRNLPSLIEFYEIQAKLSMAKYKAFVAEGFTEAQALELCK